MEQIIDWLNENEMRAYPLLDENQKTFEFNSSLWELPDDFLLDLQLIIKNNALENYIPVLNKITIVEGTVAVYFSLAHLITENLQALVVFNIIDAVAKEYPHYVRNTDGDLAVFGKGVRTLLSTYPNGAELIATQPLPIEPAVAVQFNDAWLGVSSVSTAPEKETSQSSYEPKLPLEDVYDYLQSITEENHPTSLTGHVKFLEGYNFRVDINNGLIDLEIGNNFGLRMNCETSFIEEQYLDCDELVSYINGVPPDNNGNFRLLSGANINITSGTAVSTSFIDSLTETSNDNTLFVGLTFQTTDLCNPVNITPS